MKKLQIVAGLLLLMPLVANADGNNYGSAQYLSQGIGGRAAGIGGAFVALADDVTAGYWNPAGLAQMEIYLYYLGLQYALIAPDVRSSYAAYAFQIPEIGNFGISWINCTINEIEGRDELGELTQPFSSSENALFFSYARKCFEWAKGLSLGGNIKMLQQSIAEYNAWGFGFDVGAIWQPVLYLDHTMGINIQNLGQTTYWQTDAKTMDPSLVNVKVGAALRFFPSDDAIYYHHLITTVDFDFSEYSRFGYHAGAEYWYTESLGFRSGFNGQEITAGISYRPEYYQVDYTFIYDLSELGFNQHRFALTIRIK